MLSKSRFRRHEKFINNSSPHRLCSPIALFLAGQHLYLHFRRASGAAGPLKGKSTLTTPEPIWPARLRSTPKAFRNGACPQVGLTASKYSAAPRGQQPLGDWRQGSPNERNLFSGLRQLAEDCGRSPGDPQAAPTELEEGVELSSG